MIDLLKVGKRITEHRKRIGMSQDVLAERLFVTRQALSKWENGLSAPSLDSLAEMSRLFEVSFEEILGLSEGIIELREENIFEGRDRAYVLSKIASGEFNGNLSDVFYQLSPGERMYILNKIKSGELASDVEALWPKLTPSEQRFFGGLEYEVR